MRAPKKRPTAAKLRSWDVSILRPRAHYLGTVEAPDERTAEAAAVGSLISTRSSANGWRCGRRSARLR